jgi:hypothetical protein
VKRKESQGSISTSPEAEIRIRLPFFENAERAISDITLTNASLSDRKTYIESLRRIAFWPVIKESDKIIYNNITLSQKLTENDFVTARTKFTPGEKSRIGNTVFKIENHTRVDKRLDAIDEKTIFEIQEQLGIPRSSKIIFSPIFKKQKWERDVEYSGAKILLSGDAVQIVGEPINDQNVLKIVEAEQVLENGQEPDFEMHEKFRSELIPALHEIGIYPEVKDISKAKMMRQYLRNRGELP